MWYTPPEATRRFAIFFNSCTVAGAFGSLIASGIAKMDGIRGYAGWRWIFILEGILTVVFGIGAFFIVPNFIEDAKWLSVDEKRFMQKRIEIADGISADEKQTTFGRELRKYFSDYKSYVAGILYFGEYIFFLPCIAHITHPLTDLDRRRDYRLQYRLLSPYHCQRLQIRHDPNATSQCTALCRRLGLQHHYLVPVRTSASPTRLHPLLTLNRTHRHHHALSHP